MTKTTSQEIAYELSKKYKQSLLYVNTIPKPINQPLTQPLTRRQKAVSVLCLAAAVATFALFAFIGGAVGI